jgi:hypothetical protein
VEDSIISSPKEAQTSSFQSEVHSDRILFYIHGIVHYEFVPKGETVTQYLYSDVLRRLRDEVRRKRPQNWRTGVGFSNTTVLPLALLCLYRKVCPKTGRLLLCTLITLNTWHPATFFLSKSQGLHRIRKEQHEIEGK